MLACCRKSWFVVKSREFCSSVFRNYEALAV
jgi:hypothetical protein